MNPESDGLFWDLIDAVLEVVTGPLWLGWVVLLILTGILYLTS